MLQIIVEPNNPLDLKPEELKDFAQKLASLDSGYDVQIAGEGYAAPAVTLWEVVTIWLPLVETTVLTFLVTKTCEYFFAWAKERFKKDPLKRPKSATLLGPDGRVIKVVVVKDSSNEPEDITSPDHLAEPPRKRPSLK